MKKTLIGLLAILITASAGIGFYMYQKPVASTSGLMADHRTTAEKLLDEFSTDEGKATLDYLNKVLIVDGIVDRIEQTEHTVTVFLAGSDPLSAVSCEMESGDQTLELKQGEQISIKGVCTGFLMDVVLVRSVIVQ